MGGSERTGTGMMCPPSPCWLSARTWYDKMCIHITYPHPQSKSTPTGAPTPHPDTDRERAISRINKTFWTQLMEEKSGL